MCGRFPDLFRTNHLLDVSISPFTFQLNLSFANMASSADEVPTKDEDVAMSERSGVSSPKELRNALYAKCASFEDGHVFTQDDILTFGIIPDNSIEQLLAYTKQLAKDGLFKLMAKDGKACWKVVKRADAVK